MEQQEHLTLIKELPRPDIMIRRFFCIICSVLNQAHCKIEFETIFQNPSSETKPKNMTSYLKSKCDLLSMNVKHMREGSYQNSQTKRET